MTGPWPLLAVVLWLGLSCSIVEHKLFKGPSFSFEKSARFNVTDPSGTYRAARRTQREGQKVQTLVGLQDKQAGRPLETRKIISDLREVRTNQGKVQLLRPRRSRYSVWIEKRQYQTLTEIIGQKRQILVTLTGAGKKLQKSFDLPKGDGPVCFLGQLPECLGLLLSQRPKVKKVPLAIVFESFPFLIDSLGKYWTSPLQRGQARIGRQGSEVRVDIQLEGKREQDIFLKLDGSGHAQTLAWVSRGITYQRAGP